MKKTIKNLLCSAALALGATAATAQGLQNIIVEEYHTVTAADAAAYNNVHGGGSYPLVAGMKVYRVYVDMAPNYRLTSVFATPNSPLSVNTTTTFWNDDNWGSQNPAQTRRFDEGALFDSYITINTSGTAGGAAGCGSSTTQFGVRRTADTNGDLTTCGVYPGFTGADGNIPAAFAMDPIVFLGAINYQALLSDPAPAASFGFTDALWGYVGGITGVDPAGANIAYIGQFTTDGTFSFNLNVALLLPAPSTAGEEYVWQNPTGAQVQSSLLIYPQPNLDCNGVPGGPAVPGTACNDNNPCTINDVFDANCNCAGTFQDTDSDGVCDANDNCPNVPGQIGSPCNDGNACTINDVLNASCQCAGTFQDTDSDGVCDANDSCPNVAGQVGSPCNDGNACTINDVLDANCNCAGTFQDSDSDGVCDANDSCPNVAGQVGSPCNDGNACTINDVLDANCNCAGTFQDSDSDGVCDANDSCPNVAGQIGSPCNDGNACTINDVLDANCNCAGTFQDSDSDGVCDANDPCPALANLVPGDACDDGNAATINDVITANCTCAGTLLGNDCEGVPGGPAQPGTACNDNNPCTVNDVYDANCNCAGTFQDSDSDGVCDANDPCPALANLVPGDACDDGNAATINDVITANCLCQGTPATLDCNGVPNGPAVPGTACNDNNACTINDVYDANCNCAGTFQDTDSDGVCDASDSCPTVVGQIGSPCNDGDANTINDQLNANCDCVGIPVGPGCAFNELELQVVNDAVSSLQWEVREQGTSALAANGSVTPPAGTYTIDICLPDGCYYLVVTDNGGDGVVGGGYVLRLASGQRLIDNAGNMTVGVSQIDANEGFCLPLGADRLITSSCDKYDWRQGQFVVANANTAVSAQFGVNNANSGYQMWWYNPNGGYSFKRFQSHSTTNGLAASATRACHFAINGWSGNQLQENVLYNVKVRGRVNGTYLPWGRACRFILNPLRARCPLTKLNDIPNSQYLSCGQSRNWGTGNFVSARPVSRINASGTGTQNANRYQFRFRQLDESVVTVRTSSTYNLQLNWGASPLIPGNTYLVDVRASFDNGATWCTDFIQPSVDPWGEFCTLTILGGTSGMALEQTTGVEADAARLAMYPNPNRGDQLFIALGGVDADVETVTVDIFDAFGKRVASQVIPTQDGQLNTVLDLNGALAAGLYMVNVTAGEEVRTERLVIQP